MDYAQFHHRCGETHTAWVHRWSPGARKAPARAVVQIVHGMAEHGARYGRIAERLVGAGYAVYAQDLPGHGRSVQSREELGHVDDGDGWPQTLAAINAVRSLAEREQPGAPLFLLGHSRGSFLLQDYLVEHGRGLAGAVFSAGTGDLGPHRRMAAQARSAVAGPRASQRDCRSADVQGFQSTLQAGTYRLRLAVARPC